MHIEGLWLKERRKSRTRTQNLREGTYDEQLYEQNDTRRRFNRRRDKGGTGMILDRIVAKTRERVEALKSAKSAAHIKAMATAMRSDTGFPFERALHDAEISFICEVKRASPSKGLIAEDFPYVEIARDYEAAGAAAISVLTEPYFFLGRNSYLTEIADAVRVPVLRKDFTIDSYQIYETKTIGASAVLLICALLDAAALKDHIALAHELGMSALVEAHSESEIDLALNAGARVIGVNNRDLRTFDVDITTSVRLRRLVPKGVTFVSESGIKTPDDIATLHANKADAVLIGEAFMRSADKKKQLAYLRGLDMLAA